MAPLLCRGAARPAALGARARPRLGGRTGPRRTARPSWGRGRARDWGVRLPAAPQVSGPHPARPFPPPFVVSSVRRFVAATGVLPVVRPFDRPPRQIGKPANRRWASRSPFPPAASEFCRAVPVPPPCPASSRPLSSASALARPAFRRLPPPRPHAPRIFRPFSPFPACLSLRFPISCHTFSDDPWTAGTGEWFVRRTNPRSESIHENICRKPFFQSP